MSNTGMPRIGAGAGSFPSLHNSTLSRSQIQLIMIRFMPKAAISTYAAALPACGLVAFSACDENQLVHKARRVALPSLFLTQIQLCFEFKSQMNMNP